MYCCDHNTSYSVFCGCSGSRWLMLLWFRLSLSISLITRLCSYPCAVAFLLFFFFFFFWARASRPAAAAAALVAGHRRTCNWSHESTSNRVPTSQQTNVIPAKQQRAGREKYSYNFSCSLLELFLLLYCCSVGVRRIHSIYSICQPLNRFFSLLLLVPLTQRVKGLNLDFPFSLLLSSPLTDAVI